MKNKKVEEEFIEEGSKTAIIIILAAIAVVLGLIVLTVYLSKDKENDSTIDDTGIPIELKLDESLSETTTSTNVTNVSNKKYVVKYVDIDGNQLGKTQRLNSLNDRVNEKAPRIDGMRFTEWVLSYNEEENIYYYIASYVYNVEVVSESEKVVYRKAPTHEATVTKVESDNNDSEHPTYDVEINGEIPLLEEELDEEITISEEYQNILVLRFNAPEDVTKEDIENMTIKVSSSNPVKGLEDDQYHLKAEDNTLSGRDLLDSTDEEYEQGIFYFNYYQEADSKTNTTLEVYWGNDPEASNDLLEPIPPRDEYVEVYNIKLEVVELEEDEPK